MLLEERVHEFMSLHGFAPSKKFGQNFIIDPAIIHSLVVAAELKKEDVVMEIGAGMGFLTEELQKKCRVVAVEQDRVLFDVIRENLPEKNLVLIQGDFLSRSLPHFTKIVSFPPYTISAKIMQRLFELDFGLAVLVFQKEFVEKLLAFPGFEEYNALSVLTQYHFVPQVISPVPRRSFYPVPKSDSLALKLVRKKTHGNAKNDEKFHVFVKQLFRHGKKNLERALVLSHPFLSGAISVPESGTAIACKKFPFHDVKVNQLEVTELVQVFNELA